MILLLHMKKELLIALGITILLMGGVFVFMRKPTPNSSSTIPLKTANESSIKTQTTPGVYVDISTVQTHDTADNCWIIIDKNIYEMTSYMSSHPGGAKTIIPWCGKESTNAFNTIKNGKGHSTAAEMDLDLYYLGNVK